MELRAVPVDVVRVGSGKGRRDGRLRVHPPVPADLETVHHGLAWSTWPASCCRRPPCRAPAPVSSRLTRRSVGGALSGDGLTAALDRTPLLFHELGLTGLEPQVELRDVDGVLVARVDFLDRRHRLVVELDGAMKYAGGGTGQAALVAEKRREDAIRRLGDRVLRLVWSDLLDPARVYRLVREARLTPV